MSWAAGQLCFDNCEARQWLFKCVDSVELMTIIIMMMIMPIMMTGLMSIVSSARQWLGSESISRTHKAHGKQVVLQQQQQQCDWDKALLLLLHLLLLLYSTSIWCFIFFFCWHSQRGRQKQSSSLWLISKAIFVCYSHFCFSSCPCPGRSLAQLATVGYIECC